MACDTGSRSMPPCCHWRKFSRVGPGLRAGCWRANAAPTLRRRGKLSATALYSRSGVSNMDGVTIVEHPLVQHKLTLLRKKDISTKSFRELLKEIGMLLCYEVTRDLPLADVDIETPLAHMKSPRITGKN